MLIHFGKIVIEGSWAEIRGVSVDDAELDAFLADNWNQVIRVLINDKAATKDLMTAAGES